MSSIQSGEVGQATLQTIFSSDVLTGEDKGCGGNCGGSTSNQGGPFHQRECASSSLGRRPREAQSAGFDSVGTYFHALAGNKLRIVETLFQLNVLGLPSNQCHEGQ